MKRFISVDKVLVMKQEQIRGLTLDEVAIFMILEQNQYVDELFDQFKSTDGGWVLSAIDKRFKAYEINADKRVMIAILSIGDGVVGKCAKHVDNIAVWADKFNRREIDWTLFAQKIYAHGIPIV